MPYLLPHVVSNFLVTEKGDGAEFARLVREQGLHSDEDRLAPPKLKSKAKTNIDRGDVFNFKVAFK